MDKAANDIMLVGIDEAGLGPLLAFSRLRGGVHYSGRREQRINVAYAQGFGRQS